MGLQDFFNWRSQTAAANTDAVTDDEPAAEVDEPPDHHISFEKPQSDFHKSAVRGKMDRKESLLTKALLRGPETDADKPEIHVATDLSRRRSMISNASMASTAELTSDGGLTSPARTNTPSPPPPGALYASFAPYSLGKKAIPPPTSVAAVVVKDTSDSVVHKDVVSVSPTAPVRPEIPRKRCISFVCGGKKEATPAPALTTAPAIQPPKPRRITFMCAGGKPSVKDDKSKAEPAVEKSSDISKRLSSRSPSIPRKSPRSLPQSPPRPRRDSLTMSKRGPPSPTITRAKPKCIIANENTFQSSEATRFHEFASDEPQEDDWIREEVKVTSKKMTINDTLKMENAIRKLGNEAEEEAMEEDDDDDDDEDEVVNYSEDDEDEDEDDEEEEYEDEDDDDEDEDASDGNETDNEAGFADSDDSDVEGEFAFWTPGRNIPHIQTGEPSTYRPSAHRAASASSIDSVSFIDSKLGPKSLRRPRRRPMKIRPGTPELPDSTDFVCGTLDEDRPMENAYIACMKARENAKHKQTPQDIDPSFPTSDFDEEDDDDIVAAGEDSDEHVWLHGNFEESDSEKKGRSRPTTTRRKSPIVSPRRAHSPAPTRRLHSPPPARRLHSPPPPRRHHSPPPPKQRHRSPPPRKLFGQSPRCMRSPPPARTIQSPAVTPMQSTNGVVSFMSLASRPGLTHTKSLPRAPNIFGRQYKASRIEAAAGNAYDNSDGPDGHVRGAIDIVKGLERKRQRRKEKFLQKHCNRKQKGHAERKPQPGKGAERMRELGLLMAGKTGVTDPYMMSA